MIVSSGAIGSWTADNLLGLSRNYQSAAVLAAAVDLDLFSVLNGRSLSAQEVADQLGCDLRGMFILLDALGALQLLVKKDDCYSLPAGAAAFLTAEGIHSVLAMAQHQANCLRRWAQLAKVVKTGCSAERTPSVRGDAGDQEAFIGAMHNVSAPVADQVIEALRPFPFHRLLDVGAASGTWTIAFLRARRSTTATLFDLPEVIPLAQRRLSAAGLSHRVKFIAGDFMEDALPHGSDSAWVSAIVHQNSRAQNRSLFDNLFQALNPGGWIALRDILMDEDRTSPVAGALFAVNMLVATEGGGTFTFEELREDLEAAGFINMRVIRRDEGMNSVVAAVKPSEE